LKAFKRLKKGNTLKKDTLNIIVNGRCEKETTKLLKKFL